MIVINRYKHFLNLSLLQIVLLVQCCALLIDGAHRSIDDAKAERQKLVQKYLKTLKKEEGAIKLIGGKNEYEGAIFVLQL
jgi:lysyl oxidase-like protein 2/3/4